MTATNSNAVLAKQLRDAYNTAGRRAINLPESIKCTRDNRTMRIYLDSSCLVKNMQTDSSCFEGWALALKRWLPKDVDLVELSWEIPDNVSDPHYQRFLYRLKRFQSLFVDWFKIAS